MMRFYHDGCAESIEPSSVQITKRMHLRATEIKQHYLSFRMKIKRNEVKFFEWGIWLCFLFISIAFTQKSPWGVLIAIEDKRPLLHLQEFGWKPAYMCRSLAGVWTSISRLCRLLAGIRTGICISVQVTCGNPDGHLHKCAITCGNLDGHLQVVQVTCGSMDGNLHICAITCGNPDGHLQVVQVTCGSLDGYLPFNAGHVTTDGIIMHRTITYIPVVSLWDELNSLSSVLNGLGNNFLLCISIQHKAWQSSVSR